MQRLGVTAPATLLAGRSRQPWRWGAAFGVAVALAIAAGAASDRWFPSASVLEPGALPAPGFGARDYVAAVSRAEADIAGARAHWTVAPHEWLRGEVLARALIARHRLTGSYTDLVEADHLLDAGLAAAPDPSGPVLTRASLSLLVHRLPQAEAALAKASRHAIPAPTDKADALAFAGDIALQRGRLTAAARAYAQADGLAPSPGIALRRAVLLGRSGERDEARQQLELLLARPRQAPQALAQLALQRAQLAYAEGDWSGAEGWVAAANRLFPGYWLAEAYAAQQSALAGKHAEAVRRYTAIARRSESPEVMDALAQLLRLQGRRGESLAWWRRAERLWQSRLSQFPEAAALHAAEHALIGGDPGHALALAREDARRRPHGPSLAVLARALIVAGQPGEALRQLDRAERQGWVSAGLLMLRAEASAALGDEQGSEAARERAEAINPRAADPRTRLIWFGHD